MSRIGRLCCLLVGSVLVLAAMAFMLRGHYDRWVRVRVTATVTDLEGRPAPDALVLVVAAGSHEGLATWIECDAAGTSERGPGSGRFADVRGPVQLSRHCVAVPADADGVVDVIVTMKAGGIGGPFQGPPSEASDGISMLIVTAPGLGTRVLETGDEGWHHDRVADGRVDVNAVLNVGTVVLRGTE